jgi:response regulator NasT
MESALVICSSAKGSQAISEILQTCHFSNIDIFSHGNEARRKLNERQYDLILINTPLSDGGDIELSLDLSCMFPCGVILLVKAENADQIQCYVENSGVFVVPKPVNRHVILQMIRYIGIFQNKLREMEEKNVTLQKKYDDLRTVDRAKCALIEHLHMTESQAHRYIEKKAMDMRLPKRVVAEDIIKTYML